MPCWTPTSTLGRRRLRSRPQNPTLLYNIAWWVHLQTGADIQAAVTPTKSPCSKALRPPKKAYIADLEDFEEAARRSRPADHQLQSPPPWARRLGHFPGCSLHGFTHRRHTSATTQPLAPSAIAAPWSVLFDIGNIFLEDDQERVTGVGFSQVERGR